MTPEICVIADGSGAIGLGGVMGGTSTGCSEATTEVFIESAWFDPIRTAQTGRDTGIVSDAQYRFARGVDPESLLPGIELATAADPGPVRRRALGGPCSRVRRRPGPPRSRFDPAYVERLSGLVVAPDRVWTILGDLGFDPRRRRACSRRHGGATSKARPTSWRKSPASPATAPCRRRRCRTMPRPTGGVLTLRQARLRIARRALAAAGYQETISWSFTARAAARLFGGGDERLVLQNPIAADLDCMRPSALPGLIEAVGRNARRGFPDCALFEIGPVFAGPEPADQRAVVAAVLAPHGPRALGRRRRRRPLHPQGRPDRPCLTNSARPPPRCRSCRMFDAPWWRPGRRARLQLGPKAVLAEFGELHPATLAALDVAGPVYAFELWVEAIPEPKKKAGQDQACPEPVGVHAADPRLRLSGRQSTAGRRSGARRAGGRPRPDRRRAGVRRLRGPGRRDRGTKSVAVEVTLQPRERTLTDADIEAVSAKIMASAAKAVGARLRA